MDPATYSYAKSFYFPNGVKLDNIQQLVLVSTITVLCTRVTDDGYNVNFYFQDHLSDADLATLQSIVENYVVPPDPPILLESNAPGDALVFNASGWDSGISHLAGTSGVVSKSIGPGISDHVQVFHRSRKGHWQSRGEGYLDDVDYQLKPEDLYLGILLIGTTDDRYLTFPNMTDILAQMTTDPAVDDSLEVKIINLGSAGAAHILMGENGVGFGDMTVEAGTGVHYTMRLAGLGGDSGYVYSVYGA